MTGEESGKVAGVVGLLAAPEIQVSRSVASVAGEASPRCSDKVRRGITVQYLDECQQASRRVPDCAVGSKLGLMCSRSPQEHRGQCAVEWETACRFKSASRNENLLSHLCDTVNPMPCRPGHITATIQPPNASLSQCTTRVVSALASRPPRRGPVPQSPLLTMRLWKGASHYGRALLTLLP